MKYIINLIVLNYLISQKINTIYRKILDNYSPYIPVLNFNNFPNALLFFTVIICLLIPFNILKVKSPKTLKQFSLFFSLMQVFFV